MNEYKKHTCNYCLIRSVKLCEALKVIMAELNIFSIRVRLAMRNGWRAVQLKTSIHKMFCLMKSAKKAENDPIPQKCHSQNDIIINKVTKSREKLYFSSQNDVIGSDDMWRKV